MIVVVGLLCLATLMSLGFYAWLIESPDFSQFTKPFTKYWVNSINFAFYSAVWTLVFKQWQTAYELEYLFRYDCAKRARRNAAIYTAVNIVGYGLGTIAFFTPFVESSERMSEQMKFFVSFCLSFFLSFLYAVCFFVSAVRRMNWHVKQIPLLKRAEKTYQTIMALFFGATVSVVVTSIFSVALSLKGELTKTVVILNFCLSLFALLL